jgi:DNA-binding beta-propeller fold protein YncE
MAASVPSFFIAAPNRVDMVDNSATNTLYISSTDGNLLRYNLTNKSFLTPISLGGYLYGMDISPDGNNIVVADYSADYKNHQSWVYTVNLPLGTSQQITFSTQGSSEGGVASVAFADNQTVLASSSGATWDPLRKVNIAAGTSTTIASVSASGAFVTELSASADHSVIGIAQQCIHPFGAERYEVSNGTFLNGPALANGVTAIAASRDGQQYAVTMAGGSATCIYDSSLKSLGTLFGAYADERPLGVAYSPTSDLLFVSWVNSSGSHSEIDVFNTDSLAEVGVIDSAPQFTLPAYDNSYQSGRLRVSDDGDFLFATVNGGVNVYAVPEPSTFILLGIGAISLLAYAWRQRKYTA